MFFYYKKLFHKCSNVKECGPFDIKFNFKSKKKLQEQEIKWNQSIKKSVSSYDNHIFYVSDINYLYNLMKDDIKIILPKLNYMITYDGNDLKLRGKKQELKIRGNVLYRNAYSGSVEITLRKNKIEIINKMFILVFLDYYNKYKAIHK